MQRMPTERNPRRSLESPRRCQREVPQRRRGDSGCTNDTKITIWRKGEEEGGEKKELMKATESHPQEEPQTPGILHPTSTSRASESNRSLRTITAYPKDHQRSSDPIRPGIARELITTSGNLMNRINLQINSGHNHEPSMVIWPHRNISSRR